MEALQRQRPVGGLCARLRVRGGVLATSNRMLLTKCDGLNDSVGIGGLGAEDRLAMSRAWEDARDDVLTVSGYRLRYPHCSCYP